MGPGTGDLRVSSLAQRPRRLSETGKWYHDRSNRNACCNSIRESRTDQTSKYLLSGCMGNLTRLYERISRGRSKRNMDYALLSSLAPTPRVSIRLHHGGRATGDPSAIIQRLGYGAAGPADYQTDDSPGSVIPTAWEAGRRPPNVHKSVCAMCSESHDQSEGVCFRLNPPALGSVDANSTLCRSSSPANR